MISVLIAACLIVTALCGVGVASVYMKSVLRKNELATMTVAVEAELLNAFNNKLNYPDPGAGTPSPGGTATSSPNPQLRAGTITSLNLNTSKLGVLTVPLFSPSPAPVKSLVQFMDWSFNPCTAFDGKNCVLRMEVRLKKSLICGPPACAAGQEVYAYAFSYQVDADPNVAKMSALGNITNFDTAIDPGYYRVEATLANCNPATDLFMTGVNRDTGEAYCAKKPVNERCADGHVPKGVKYTPHDVGEPTIELDCTADSMRTFKCEPNYSLQAFNPLYVDPDNTTFGTSVPGSCVLSTRSPALTPSSYPPTPTPYMISVSGTICPPLYKVANANFCTLAPDAARNNDIAYGKGKCADTAYKNCTRTTWTDTTTSDGGAAYAAWSACMATPPPPPPTPPPSCGSAPPNPVYTTTRTCSGTQTSLYCNGAVTSGTACANFSGWDSGSPYATSIHDTFPTASTTYAASGRNYSCTFKDDSASQACSAPTVDFFGNPMTWKTPKWYGGVQIVGAQCVYDPAQNSGKPEVRPAM